MTNKRYIYECICNFDTSIYQNDNDINIHIQDKILKVRKFEPLTQGLGNATATIHPTV